MSFFIIILNVFELCACLAGYFSWDKIKHTYWKWFPIYLSIIFLTEVAAEIILYVGVNQTINIALYSYFGIPLQFFFFYWLFYFQFQNSTIRKWSLLAAAIYFLCLISDLSFIDKIELFFESFSYTIGCLFLLILLLLYLARFIKSEEIITYKTNMMFWVAIGLMVFYIGTMPFWAFRKYLYVNHREFFYMYWYIQFGLNYLMYLLFSIAFIWGKPK